MKGIKPKDIYKLDEKDKKINLSDEDIIVLDEWEEEMSYRYGK